MEAYEITFLPVHPPFLILSFSVRLVSYQKKVGDYFFPEIFV
jgi:hypothetical protein